MLNSNSAHSTAHKHKQLDLTTMTTRALVEAKKTADIRFNLFSPGNPKTAKGEKYGVWTVVLHLAPARLSGFETCPKRTAGCTMACLNLAGRGGLAAGGFLTHEEVASGTRSNNSQKARIRRTKEFFEARASFMAKLGKDIRKAIFAAAEAGIMLAIRLNGTSDIRWENIPFENHRNVMEAFPFVQFYDYTKIANRRNIPSNYHLTFSLAENNDAEASRALQNGINVAAVFRSKEAVKLAMGRGMALSGQTYTVVDGDDSDLRFMDPRGAVGVVVGLYAKGPAKKDTSGFVRD